MIWFNSLTFVWGNILCLKFEKFLPEVRPDVRAAVACGGVWGSPPRTAASRTSCPSRSRDDPTNSECEMCSSPENKKR